MNILLVINCSSACMDMYRKVFYFLSVLLSARLQKRVNFLNNIEC